MNKKTQYKKIQDWANSLSEDKARELLADLVERLIETEEIGFSEDRNTPHWDANGENIDGTED
jgi:hypothetical protein